MASTHGTCVYVRAALCAALLIGLWAAPVSPETAFVSGPETQITEAPIGDAPAFAVRLIFLDPMVEFTACTGVVLSQHWVLTAAHCVRSVVAHYGVYAPGRLTIRYGADGTDGGPESYTSGDASYYIHPDYGGDDGDLKDDFALIRLYGGGMSSYTEARIMGDTSECFFNGGGLEELRMAGYGRGTDPGDGGDCPSSGGGYKRSGRFYALPNCGAIPFNGWSPKSPFVREVVVDSGSRTACAGDSGGPIYFHYDGLEVAAGLFAGTRDELGDTQRGPSIRRRLDWIIDKSIEKGLPLDCQPGFSDNGPDWWLCQE